MWFVWFLACFLPLLSFFDWGLLSLPLAAVMWALIVARWVWQRTPSGRVGQAAKVMKAFIGADPEAAQLLQDYHAFFRTGKFEEPGRSIFIERMKSKAASLIAENARRQEHQRDDAANRAIAAEAEAQRELKERYRVPMNDKG